MPAGSPAPVSSDGKQLTRQGGTDRADVERGVAVEPDLGIEAGQRIPTPRPMRWAAGAGRACPARRGRQALARPR